MKNGDQSNNSPAIKRRMTMKQWIFAAPALAALLLGAPAVADQYVLQIDGNLAQTSDGLRNTLKIDQIDAFTFEGKDYVVVGAPDEGYLEAYFQAARHSPKTLSTLDTDWDGPGLAGLTMERRMQFMTPGHCEFCAP
jgi:hypothetical protein